MTDTDDPQHRTYHQADPDRVELRQEGDQPETFDVRMPIASTGQVRNEGDDPLSDRELGGMRDQVESRTVGVFLDHGSNPDVAGSRYSATEKVGEWRDAEIETREGASDELVATARLMDPETLPAATGSLREALASLKEQVKRDMSLSASIGWREDEDFPGGVDLMEASIVGIPADPRTTSHGAAVEAARSVLEQANVPQEEREALVEEFRAVVMGPDADEGGDARETVTETEDSEPDGEQSEGTDEEQTERDVPDWGERLLEQQEQQTEILRALAESLREDDDDEEDDEEENEGDNDDEDDDEDEQSATPEDEQDADAEQDLREEVEALREELAEARKNGDINTPDAEPDDEQDAETDEEREASDQPEGPDWRA